MHVDQQNTFKASIVLPVWRADSHEQDTAILPCDLHVGVLFLGQDLKDCFQIGVSSWADLGS